MPSVGSVVFFLLQNNSHIKNIKASEKLAQEKTKFMINSEINNAKLVLNNMVSSIELRDFLRTSNEFRVYVKSQLLGKAKMILSQSKFAISIIILDENNNELINVNKGANKILHSFEQVIFLDDQDLSEGINYGKIILKYNLNSLIRQLGNVDSVSILNTGQESHAKITFKEQNLSFLSPVISLVGILILILLVIFSFFFLKQLLINPIQKLILDLEESNLILIESENDSGNEVIKLEKLVSSYKKLIDENQKKILAQEKSKVKSILASQVFHDIKSPLTALELVINDSKTDFSDSSSLDLMKSSISRIKGITDNLLKDVKNNFNSMARYNLDSILLGIVVEKKKEIEQFEDIEIFFDQSSFENVTVFIDKIEFERLVSNIINNSIDALKDSRGNIIISGDSSENEILIKIADNGIGIPKEFLSQIGMSRFSNGKEHEFTKGTGLGLLNATSKIEIWGGRINIESTEGKGTCVNIFLPFSKKINPSQLVSDQTFEIVHIDNDPLIRHYWKQKANESKKSLLSVSGLKELDSKISDLSLKTKFYIDYHLGDNEMGSDVAEKLHKRGFTELYLASADDTIDLSEYPFIKKLTGKRPPW